MRRFLMLFAIKYFKIEKTSEKKNYRGLQYLSSILQEDTTEIVIYLK